jgi:hypothetical protein
MSEKTEDRHMLSLKKLDIKLQLNLGELEEQFLVFLVSLVVELIVLDKPPLETCAEEDVCLLPQRPGEDGTDE